jgi:ParB family chromosome partitioning protein
VDEGGSKRSYRSATEIPAVVIQAFTRGLFCHEPRAKSGPSHYSPLDVMRRNGELRKRRYTIAASASMTDFSDEYIHAICFLLEHGEERLQASRTLRPARE